MTEVKEAFCNLWEMPADAVCITTNGQVNRFGEAVMGAGVAKQAKQRYPWLPLELGMRLRQDGNHVQFFGNLYDRGGPKMLITFPVKHGNYKENADPTLIARSVAELMVYALKKPSWTFLLPRPGCDNGRLDWERDVKPLCEALPDNVIVVELPEKAMRRRDW